MLKTTESKVKYFYEANAWNLILSYLFSKSIFDLQKDRIQIRELTGFATRAHDGWFSDLARVGQTTLVSSGWDDKIMFWKLDGPDLPPRLIHCVEGNMCWNLCPHGDKVFCVRLGLSTWDQNGILLDESSRDYHIRLMTIYDEKFLLIGANDKMLLVEDIVTGERLLTIAFPFCDDSDKIHDIASSEFGHGYTTNTFVVLFELSDDGTALIILKSFDLSRAIDLETDAHVSLLIFENIVVVMPFCNKLFLIDKKEGSICATLQIESGLCMARVSSTRFVTADKLGNINIFDINCMEPILSYQFKDRFREDMRIDCFTIDGDLIYVGLYCGDLRCLKVERRPRANLTTGRVPKRSYQEMSLE